MVIQSPMRSSPATDNESFIESHDPVTGELVWRGPRADPREIGSAMDEAREAQIEWRRKPFADRAELARAFARVVETHAAELAFMISRENGKPRWEARTEASAVVAKVELSITAHGIRCNEFGGGGAVTRFQPHGVVVVLGPYNFPAHLPNGHIVPALLAGNAVVFKPSEHTPGVADFMARCWREAGLPHGLCQILHGGASLGKALATHGGTDGVFFTGSESVGRKLLQWQASHPGKILALEMGGNNPLVLSNVADADAAAVLIAQSAFLSAGQRCTCARRLIVIDSEKSNNVLASLVHIARTLAVGHYNDQPEPFMGPVITNEAADRILKAQEALMDAGGNALLRAERQRPNIPLLRPGILDVTNVGNRPDEEIFGPLLQVIREIGRAHV